ncbi:hypothetical protein [Agromyces humi]|uniref:hypothetical protein n=1 Tax=Agromyces humi TaxID=1766800 RepID=UPI001356B76C|nr:hypothetical protein [Agromyces humi]
MSDKHNYRTKPGSTQLNGSDPKPQPAAEIVLPTVGAGTYADAVTTIEMPYPTVPIVDGEAASFVVGSAESVDCICGNDIVGHGFTAAARDGRVANLTGSGTGLAEADQDGGLAVCNRCGRVYDDRDLATETGESPVLARVDVNSVAWADDRAIYENQFGTTTHWPRETTPDVAAWIASPIGSDAVPADRATLLEQVREHQVLRSSLSVNYDEAFGFDAFSAELDADQDATVDRIERIAAQHPRFVELGALSLADDSDDLDQVNELAYAILHDSIARVQRHR